ASGSARKARLRRTWAIRDAYGRARTIACCDRRRRAALTIFLAFVTCIVFLTERMRRLRSRVFAIRQSWRSSGRFRGNGQELLLEVVQDLLQLRAERIVEGLLGPDLL